MKKKFYYIKFAFGSFRPRLQIRTIFSDQDPDPAKRLGSGSTKLVRTVKRCGPDTVPAQDMRYTIISNGSYLFHVKQENSLTFFFTKFPSLPRYLQYVLFCRRFIKNDEV